MHEEIIDYVDSRREEIITYLKSLIDEKAGSENTEAVNRVGDIFCKEFN